jgi:hypothetical protein
LVHQDVLNPTGEERKDSREGRVVKGGKLAVFSSFSLGELFPKFLFSIDPPRPM